METAFTRYAIYNMNDVVATAEFIIKNNPNVGSNGWTVDYVVSSILNSIKRIVKSQGTPEEMWYLGTMGYYVFIDEYDEDSRTGYLTIAHQPRFSNSLHDHVVKEQLG